MGNMIRVNGKTDAAGEYDFPENFTFREMHVIKRVTSLRAGEIYPALQSGDTDVIAAFAIVAVMRAKPWLDAEKLVLDSNIDAIEIVVEEAEESPPAEGGAEAGAEAA